ncbi:MAG: phosphatidate cytidylyltransferase [Solirubrobacterales bacterium]
MESSGGGRGDERSRAFDFDLNVELEFDRIGREDEREPLGGELEPAPFVSETPAEGAAPVRPSGPAAKPRPRKLPAERGPRSARSETLARILWAIPWIVYAVTIVAVGGLLFAGAMIAFAFIGLSELFRMASADRPLQIVAFVASAGMIVAAYYGSSFQIVLAGAAAFPVMFCVAATRGSIDGVTRSMAMTAFGVLWIGLPFAHAVLLRELPLHGGALLINVLVATFVADTSAYAVGRMVGRHKLAPDLSPNKTMEGMIGGFIGGTMGFWFAGLYQDWLPGIDALLMGMVIAVLAPMGDLFESMIKRDLGAKDSGGVFGPHGGVLDRLDAVLFTIVAGYYLSIAFVY